MGSENLSDNWLMNLKTPKKTFQPKPAPKPASVTPTPETVTDKSTGTPTKESKMTPELKVALISGAAGAAGGLLSGIASAMMSDDAPPPTVGHSAIQGGSPGNIKGTSGEQMAYGKAQLKDNPSFALELLRRRG